MTGAKRRGSALWGLLAALIVVSVLGMQSYTGSAVVFACFCACYLTMLGLIVPKPRVYAYTFFSALLFLGFWLKAIVQAILKTGFLEPTGDFTGTAAEWDAALIAASCAAAGVIVA